MNFCRRIYFLVITLIIAVGVSLPSIAYAGPKQNAKRDLRKIYKLLLRIANSSLTPYQLSQLAIARNKFVDSDNDSIPDIIENIKGSLDSCDADTDGDGKDDGEDEDSGASSSSSGGSSSSSSSSSSGSDSSSSSSGSSSSSSSGDDDD